MGDRESILDHQHRAVHNRFIGIMDDEWEQGLSGYLWTQHESGIPLSELYRSIRADSTFQNAAGIENPTMTTVQEHMNELFWVESVRTGHGRCDVAYRVPITDISFDALYTQHMRGNTSPDGGRRPKYLAPDEFYGRKAANTLRTRGTKLCLLATFPLRNWRLSASRKM